MFLSFFQGSKICHCVFLRSELPNINRMINPRRAPCHKGTTQCSSSFLEFVPFFPAAVPATIPAFVPFTLPGSETLVCSSHGCQERREYSEGREMTGERKGREMSGIPCNLLQECRTKPLLLFRAFSSCEKLF